MPGGLGENLGALPISRKAHATLPRSKYRRRLHPEVRRPVPVSLDERREGGAHTCSMAPRRGSPQSGGAPGFKDRSGSSLRRRARHEPPGSPQSHRWQRAARLVASSSLGRGLGAPLRERPGSSGFAPRGCGAVAHGEPTCRPRHAIDGPRRPSRGRPRGAAPPARAVGRRARTGPWPDDSGSRPTARADRSGGAGGWALDALGPTFRRDMASERYTVTGEPSWWSAMASQIDR